MDLRAALFGVAVVGLAISAATVARRGGEKQRPYMVNPVVYFEIPVSDLPRATRFYESVFDVRLERKSMGANEMALFPSAFTLNGTSGALAKGESYTPSPRGTRVYFATVDIDATLAKVQRAGGRTLHPKTSLGSLGTFAEFEDSEGNRIALHMGTK